MLDTQAEEFAVLSELMQRWLQVVALERGGIELDIASAMLIDATVDESAGEGLTPRVPSSQGPRCYLPLNMVHQSEPRISSVARCLTAITQAIGLQDADGNRIDPDGFRLKPLETWRTKIRPEDTEPIEHYLASGVCNVACEFCYEFGTPDELRTPKQRISLSELQTRLKYYDPAGGYALFDIFHQYYDAFSHPHCMTILRQVRERTAGVLDLITNGRTLTREIVDKLEGLLPLQLTISLNSADPRKRHLVMRDKTPEVAARSLPMLAQRDIPFGIVVVPWPPLIEETDLEATIEYVDRFSPNFVSVSLPGYSAFLPNVPTELNEEFHQRIVAAIRRLRPKYDTPLLLQPRLAESEWWDEPHERPFVLGSMPRTAARLAGFRYGDKIVAINGKRVEWAYEAHRFLELLELYGNGVVDITSRRGNTSRNCRLVIDDDARKKGRGFGVLIGQGIRPESLDPIVRSAEKGDTIWVLSSKWMAASVGRMLGAFLEVESLPENVSIKTVANRFFGGNIALGDLLTTRDFEVFLHEELRREPAPARVFVPASPFSDWEKDLCGRDRDHLKRTFSNKIEFLECNRIMM